MARPKNVAFSGVLAIWALFLILFVFLVGPSLAEARPPAPQLHPHGWLACALMACLVLLIWHIVKRPSWAIRISACVVLAAAAGYLLLELRTAGSDMDRVEDRRVRSFERSVRLWFGFPFPLSKGTVYKIGNKLEQDPPLFHTAIDWRETSASRENTMVGPFYQRYNTKEDIEKVGWRPTPTWTGDPKIVLIYTPKPIMRRSWFRPVVDAWITCHGDGSTKRLRSVRELREALRVDAERRKELGMPLPDDPATQRISGK